MRAADHVPVLASESAEPNATTVTLAVATPAAPQSLSLQNDRKRVETLRARAALAGFTASLIEADDGRPQLVVSRWALTRSFSSLDELENWLDRVGAPG